MLDVAMHTKSFLQSILDSSGGLGVCALQELFHFDRGVKVIRSCNRPSCS